MGEAGVSLTLPMTLTLTVTLTLLVTLTLTALRMLPSTLKNTGSPRMPTLALHSCIGIRAMDWVGLMIGLGLDRVRVKGRVMELRVRVLGSGSVCCEFLLSLDAFSAEVGFD